MTEALVAAMKDVELLSEQVRVKGERIQALEVENADWAIEAERKEAIAKEKADMKERERLDLIDALQHRDNRIEELEAELADQKQSAKRGDAYTA